jgi:hypothetical protein
VTDLAERTVSPTRTVLTATVVAAASLVLGILTFFAQGFLPDAVRSFANSASGWTLLTALLVFGSRAGARLGAALGAVSFVLLVVGYALAAALNQLFYSPLLFGIVGVVAGPFVGLAAVWLRGNGIRAALGTALLAGIFSGEAAYGLTVVADTTRPEYWQAIGAVGVALLVGMLVRRLRGWRSVTVAVAGTLTVAIVFNLAYVALGSL